MLMIRSTVGLVAVLGWVVGSSTLVGQDAKAGQSKPAPRLKEEMRMPWERSNERFLRRWLVLGGIPLAAAASGFDNDWLAEHGGETAIRPVENMTHKLPNGLTIKWRSVTAWGDATDLAEEAGPKGELVGYAFTKISRKEDGKALLSVGSDESIRVWVNGAVVLDKRTRRPLTFDEDQVEVDLKAGENSLLVKLEQISGPWTFAARVLERGAIPPRIQEIGPSLAEDSKTAVVIKTDINRNRAEQDKVTVQVVGAGGRVFAQNSATRGESVRFDPAGWPDGAYEFRCTTRRLNGLLYATHLPWYKGDAVAAARKLVSEGAKADLQTPEGFTTKMLADMVTSMAIDSLGKDLDKVTGNPWWAIHSPLMEFEEIRLEARMKTARVRPYGFVRLAYRDDIDGSPQFCRAYLPGGYDTAKKWPLVVRIHGYNPANPEYVRWWYAGARHMMADVEYSGRQGIIYIEPHGRGNTNYLGLGDQDVLRVIQLAKERFSVDENRVYLVGDSMGGWGTWNVGTRHPDLFAAIAPVYGGADYHSQMSEEQLAKLNPVDRFVAEKESSWAMAEGLLHMPILVIHGDADKSVNVEFSRYGVRMLQRWGYNVRYLELPGFGHEDLNALGRIVEWFLPHRRVANPSHVRIRSAELQNASAYWVKVEQSASPREFMIVDAEIAGPNTIRVDSQNVLSLALSPGAGLIDPSKAVTVLWNGEPRIVRVQEGRLELRSPGYERGPLEKNSKMAGPIDDIFNTPFAIVAGTVAADQAMNEICRRKTEALVSFWKQWQRQPPRTFKDSEISDRDASRYSLILIGGPDANLLSRRFAGKVPLEVAADHIVIAGRSFLAADARVQMIFPNPLNPQRYVLVVAANSAGGMYLWSPERLRSISFDYTIEDGHMPGGDQFVSPTDLWVTGGWFDHRWQAPDILVIPGNASARSRSVVLRAPKPGGAIDGKVLDSYVGGYEVAPGTVVKVRNDGGRLTIHVGAQPEIELHPVSDVEFYVVEGSVKLVFEKDASGKVAAIKVWQGGREFSAKKIE